MRTIKPVISLVQDIVGTEVRANISDCDLSVDELVSGKNSVQVCIRAAELLECLAFRFRELAKVSDENRFNPLIQKKINTGYSAIKVRDINNIKNNGVGDVKT